VNKFYESVKEFQEAFGQTPSIHRRVKLIEEEYKELMEAIPLSLVFSYSSDEPMPYNMDAIFDKVHESNMSKLGDDGKPIYREDGKVLKSSNYKEPDLSGV
jgi:predicted HAD superfamily Cof-like phosphohydrolase